jgi:hypothetical protein
MGKGSADRWAGGVDPAARAPGRRAGSGQARGRGGGRRARRARGARNSERSAPARPARAPPGQPQASPSPARARQGPHRWARLSASRERAGASQAPGRARARRRPPSLRKALKREARLFFFRSRAPRCSRSHSSPVGRHDHARPVERVAAGIVLDAVQGQLGADQEDEEGDGRVEGALAEGDAPVGALLEKKREGEEGGMGSRGTRAWPRRWALPLTLMSGRMLRNGRTTSSGRMAGKTRRGGGGLSLSREMKQTKSEGGRGENAMHTRQNTAAPHPRPRRARPRPCPTPPWPPSRRPSRSSTSP